MNFKKCFSIVIVSLVTLSLHSMLCASNLSTHAYVLTQFLQQTPIPSTASLIDHSTDPNFATHAQTFWNNWVHNQTEQTWSSLASGIQRTIDEATNYTKSCSYAGISSDVGGCYTQILYALQQAAYYATAPTQFTLVQNYIAKIQNAKTNDGIYPIASIANIAGLIMEVQDAVNFLNSVYIVNAATDFVTIQVAVNNAINYMSSSSATRQQYGRTLRPAVINALIKAATGTLPGNYEATYSLINAAQKKFTSGNSSDSGSDFNPAFNALVTTKIAALKVASINKNFDQIVTALTNVVSATTTDATLKTNLNTAIIAALKTAAGLVTTDTQCNQLSSLITTAQANAAISSSDLTKIATEVGYVTQFYTSSITFDKLKSTLTNALKITTPLSLNFANHVYKALTTLITLIPSGVVRSPVTTRADTSANKAAATARANAIKDAKKTFDTARSAKFMASFKAQINALSTQLPKN